jgi:hypothetical protein
VANRKLIDTGAGTIGRFPPIALIPGAGLTEQQVKWISDSFAAIADAINGNLSFGTGAGSTRGGNFHSQWVNQVFAVAGVEVEIPHGLGRKPTDVWFGLPSKPCRFSTAMRGSWGLTSIWVACDTDAVTVPLLIF